MPDKKIYLLDAFALIYRSYFAFQRNPIYNSKGMNTSAIYGFVNTLLDVLKKEKPTHIGVAFDSIGPTARHEDFTEYKANRDAMPEDIQLAIPYIIEILKALKIPILQSEGYEADDVIGTLSVQAENEGYMVYMMTPDKDFGQLVTDKVLMYKPGRAGKPNEILGTKEICENFGISYPKQVIDFLGLSGDASDNIPGIPGVGPVTAKKLLKEFGSIENIIEKAGQIKNERIKNLVKEHAQQALMSKNLATIILDVPIDFDSKDLVIDKADTGKLKELFDELEFKTLAQRFFTEISLQEHFTEKEGKELIRQTELFSETKNIHEVKHEYILVQDEAVMDKIIQQIKEKKKFCFDTETTNIDANYAEIIGISFCTEAQKAYYIPFGENYDNTSSVLKKFSEVFADESLMKIGQNIKYDIEILKWYDVEVKGEIFDTMIAHYLIDPDMRHGLDDLALQYLNYECVSIESIIGKKGSKQLNMKTVQEHYPDKVKDYACEDADITFQLYEVLKPMLAKQNVEKLYNEIEAPLIRVLAAMEWQGVKIDKEILSDFSSQLEKEISKIEKEIFDKAGDTFNVSSPKQLGDILFDKLKIADKPKKTKTGQYSTSEDVLVKLENKHPIIRDVLDFRSLTKLKSTYVDALPELINPRTNRIHTHFNQAVTATGRLSSNNPNLQNIPIRTEQGREIRKAFVPQNEDYILLSADYSQIELRIIAHISGDEGMLEAFRQGKDIHTATASKVYNVDIQDVNSAMRRNAKTVNFGIIYGISAFGLSERLNISRSEASDIIHQYFVKYPKIKEYMDKTVTFAEEYGYVETLMKRRRYLPDIHSRNAMLRGFAKRNAINAPIQGSSADMIKIAMIDVYRAFEKENLRTKMIIQVHDELVFDVHREEVEQVKKIVKDKMVNAMKLDVPIEIEMSTGKHWLEAH